MDISWVCITEMRAALQPLDTLHVDCPSLALHYTLVGFLGIHMGTRLAQVGPAMLQLPGLCTQSLSVVILAEVCSRNAFVSVVM
jgi:hypothetical protein